MARGAVKPRQKPKAPPPKQRSRGLSAAEQEMFFPKLRRQAKWVFVFLALVFGVGFVVFGVGSGSNGLTDLLQGNISLFGGNDNGVGKARDRVKEHPNDPAAYRALATALQQDNKRDEAIAPLESYTTLKPKDVDALRELGTLYLDRASRFRDEAAAAQGSSQATYASVLFRPQSDTPIGRELSQDPIDTAVSSVVNDKVTQASTKMQQAFSDAVGIYQRLAALEPREPSVQFDLAQAAEQARRNDVAIAAYTRFIKLAPQDPTVPAIKQRIKELTSSTQATSPVPVGG